MDREITDAMLRDYSKKVSAAIAKLQNRVNLLSAGIGGVQEDLNKLTLAVSNGDDLGSLKQQMAKLEITAEEIRSEVSETERSLTGEIREAKSTISQTATEIRSEVTETVGGINGTISTMQSAIDQKPDSISLSVTDGTNGPSIRISLKDKEGNVLSSSSGTITLTGLVKVADMEDENSVTTIRGANIETGTISADYVDIMGKFSVWNDDSECGGQIGFLNGSYYDENTGKTVSTNGIGLSYDNLCYIIVTEAGIRLQCGPDNCLYLYRNQYGQGVNTVINGNLVLNGDLLVDGAIGATGAITGNMNG